MRLRKIVIVGVGLIGGSCALALKRAGAVGEVVGVGRTRTNLDTALERGIIDRALTLDAAGRARRPTPTSCCSRRRSRNFPRCSPRWRSRIGPTTVITDAGSTKQDVIAAARAAFGRRLARFVPGHPIAGTEHTGAAAAFASLFDGPQRDPHAASRDRAACARQGDGPVEGLRGARTATLAPDRHDAIFAAVSHLPHVLAFTLVAELAARPDAAAYFDHAASGFRDFTRIAGSSPEMWRDIALANREALLAEIDGYGDALKAARALIAAGDGAAIAAMFAEASTARRAWEARRVADKS